MAISGLTPYAHVADVQRSVDFYRHLGLELRNSHEEGGVLAIPPSLRSGRWTPEPRPAAGSTG